MKLLDGIEQIPVKMSATAAMIGNFDGVHLGHQAMLERLITEAKAQKLASLVILFEPQPSEYFLGEQAPARLSTLREKLDIFGRFDLDYVCCLRFNEALALMQAEKFAKDYLFSTLKVMYLLVGDDFRFGHKREGDARLLGQLGEEVNAQVNFFSDYLLGQDRVSSTLIRQAVEAGDLRLAKQLLGRAYSLCGRVMSGDGRGREFGVPTANIQLNRKQCALAGVYCVHVKREDGTELPAVANVGVRPTIDGDNKTILEVHILDFDEALYDEMLEVFFLEKLRDEKKFDSLNLLFEQIQQDIQLARRYFQN